MHYLKPSHQRHYISATSHCCRKNAIALFSAASVLVFLALNAVAQTRGQENANLPRFASLKANPVNLRTGPGSQYPKAWVFRRAGLPVEIIQTHGAWRRIRASDGVNGWISQYLLSGRRTALVLPWEANKSPKPIYADLKSAAQANSKNIARLEAGTLLSIRSCDGQWCYVNIQQFRGYIAQNKLWGVYPAEKIA